MGNLKEQEQNMVIIKAFPAPDITEEKLSHVTNANDKWGIQLEQIISNMLCMGVSQAERYYIAEQDSKVVGLIYGYALPDGVLFPEFLYVHPEYRGQNIGEKLISELEKNSGCNVSKIVYHKSLHDYYEKQGYKTGDSLETAVKMI